MSTATAVQTLAPHPEAATGTVRECEWCGKALRKPARGPLGRFCPNVRGQTRCRDQWAQEQERLERLRVGEGRICDICGGPIPLERNALARRCGNPRCDARAKYQATKSDSERLERHRERTRAAVAKRRKVAEGVYGGKCAVCGETELLEFDHRREDGNEHRRTETISSMILRIANTGRLENYELQLLCQRHHRMKGEVERGAYDEYRITTVAELHRVLEASLTYTSGVLLSPENAKFRATE